MTPHEVYEMFEQMRHEMGAERLLDELYNALTTQEVEANLEYIARMWDIEY